MSSRKINQIDIAICTWNRAPLLSKTLASIADLEVQPQIELSVVIVDNQSSDATPSVIDKFKASPFSKTHRVTSMVEAVPGHTHCRNRAVASCDGDLILWTDDDVTLSRQWLTKYVDAANAGPHYAFWGSVIEPQFECQRPNWISENWDILKGCFAHRDLGTEPIEFTQKILPYGANFAVRTKIQKAFPYDTELGRRGNQVLGEDELDLFRRVISEGHRGSWVPGATVRHHIPKERSTEGFVYDYFVGQGRALVAKGTPWHKNRNQLKRESLSEFALYKAKRIFAASPTWVSHLIRSALAKGQSVALAGEPHRNQSE